MRRIKQRRMLRQSSLNQGARCSRTAQFKRHRDDLDTLTMEFVAQCLPPGQVERAASIRGPGDDHDLLTEQGGQPEFVSV